MAKLVSDRYASALFEAGMDLDKTKEFHEELIFLEKVFKEEKKLLDILHHPKITNAEKRDVISSIFEKNLSQEMMNFLYILIDKRREDHIIAEEYKEFYNDYKNIVRVVAVTAVPMEDKAKNKLIETLENKLNKTIELGNEIDESLIGGVLLKLEDKLIDGSVKGQLEAMGNAIQRATN